MTKILNIAILGASGYTGAELIRLIYPHPKTHIALLTGDSQAGKPIGNVYPHLSYVEGLPNLVKLDEADYSNIDVVFCCLPHGTTQPIIASLPNHLKIIDLSADFRLKNVVEYASWYGHEHQAVGLQKEAVYGLTEHARAELKNARLVANPGCYPTSALLPLLPLLSQKIIAAESIIIDAKSGITGAGRAAKQANLFAEIDGGISAYGVAHHRHTPEIEQGLAAVHGAPVHITFTPHLMPMNRGMLATIYANLAPNKNAADARAALVSAYKNEPFVHVLEEGVVPTTHMVRGTNHCVLNVFADRVSGKIILISAIDNLMKGASGQALQNMNHMCGFPETLGLEQVAVFP